MRKLLGLCMVLSMVILIWDNKTRPREKDLVIEWGDTFPTNPLIIPYEKAITNRDTSPYKGNWVDPQ